MPDGFTFDQFFNAIAQQESGGDYSAVNPRTGALGRYQILSSNIDGWSRQYLGRAITPRQFRGSSQLQDQLARAVLQDYYTKWGARGAAAAWYSGSPKKANSYKRFRSNEPSIGEYVDQVLGHIGGPAPTTPKGAGVAPVDVPDLTVKPQGVDDLALTPDTFGRVFSAAGGNPAPPGMTRTTVNGHGSDPRRDNILSEAMRYIGTPYVWGGRAPGGFDCSGLIQFVYGKHGIDLPRISADQANFGSRVALKDLRPGDLVAWDNSSRNSGADHIAIYAGNGEIIEAPHVGASVRTRKLGPNENAWGVALTI